MGDQDQPGKGFTVTDRRSSAEGDTQAGAAEAAGEAGGKALPHIDFETFILSVAQSVLIHLGEITEGTDGPNLPLAKQTIDILGMLEEKTRGNLTDDEARLLQHLLYDLRLKYVEARKRG